MTETGVLDFEMETWVGYFARAGTPAPVLARLRSDFDKVMAQPEVAAMLEKRGARPVRLTLSEAEALIARDRRAAVRAMSRHIVSAIRDLREISRLGHAETAPQSSHSSHHPAPDGHASGDGRSRA